MWLSQKLLSTTLVQRLHSPVLLDQHLLHVKPNRMFRIFKLVRTLPPFLTSLHPTRDRTASVRGSFDNAHVHCGMECEQTQSAHGRSRIAFLCTSNQNVVLLDVSSERNWEGNAPVSDSDFLRLGRFEQIHAHVHQFCCECILVSGQLLRCDLTGAIEQVDHRCVDLTRHVLCTDLPQRDSKHVGCR